MTWLEQLGQDVRFGARTLKQQPGFAAAAIVTLALATGATTAIFSIVYGVLLRPLPFADPDRLVRVYGRNWQEDRPGVPDPINGPVGSLELEEFAKQSTSFAGFVGHATGTRLLDGAGGPQRVTTISADLQFFSLLGVDAAVGRTFQVGDPLEVAVISGRLWRQRFAGDPSLPGRTVRLNDTTYTIVGVMPDGFQFPYIAAGGLSGAVPESRTDVWIPVPPLRSSPSGSLRQGRIDVTARLRPGVTLDAALSELRVIAARVEQTHYQGTPRRVGVAMSPLHEVVVQQVRRSLWILFAAVGLVLAAACASVANLLLARMTVRTREVVTRAALGATRLRLVRQFLAESLLIALSGGVVGVFVARWATSLLVSLGSAKIPRAHEVGLDWRAFGFLLLACALTAVLFGLAPALAAARADVQSIASEAGGRASMGRTFARLRDGLVVVEVALAFVLALGAAFVVREVARLHRVETGMVTENVLTLHLTPSVPAPAYYAIEERVSRLPGVLAAGLTQLVPLQNWGWTGGFAVRGRDLPGRPAAGLRYVTPGYFRALGIPLVRGRALSDSDTADAPRVILVNEALASRYLPNEDPVGLALDRGTIVGVVGNVRQAGLDAPPEPEIYYPAAQNIAMTSNLGMSLIVRGAGPELPVDLIRSAVRDVNPGIAIFNVKRMTQVLTESLWELNLYRWLIGLFASLTLLLAAIGLHGVISYDVTARTREFAVRLAIGSDPRGIALLVVRRGVALTMAGLAAGILGAYWTTPLMRNLHVAEVGSPATYVAISALLLGIALAACLVPAVRVARVDPATALRHD